MHAKSLQLCRTLSDSVDCSPPGSSVHGILQARILEWVAFPSTGDLPNPGIEPASFILLTLAGGLFTTRATWKFSWEHVNLLVTAAESITCPPACLWSAV